MAFQAKLPDGKVVWPDEERVDTVMVEKVTHIS